MQNEWTAFAFSKFVLLKIECDFHNSFTTLHMLYNDNLACTPSLHAMCVCVCILHVHSVGCSCQCGGHSRTSGVFICHIQHISLRQGVLLDQKPSFSAKVVVSLLLGSMFLHPKMLGVHMHSQVQLCMWCWDLTLRPHTFHVQALLHTELSSLPESSYLKRTMQCCAKPSEL